MSKYHINFILDTTEDKKEEFEKSLKEEGIQFELDGYWVGTDEISYDCSKIVKYKEKEDLFDTINKELEGLSFLFDVEVFTVINGKDTLWTEEHLK